MMRNNLSKLALAATVVLSLGACVTQPSNDSLPEMTFAHVSKMPLDTATFEVISDWAVGQVPSMAAFEFPVPPQEAMRRWATSRYQPAGTGDNRLKSVFVIRRADAKEEELDVEKGVVGLFKKEQSVRYTVELEGILEIRDEFDQRLAYSSATAVRTQTLDEDASLVKRDKVRYELVETAMKDFDRSITQNVIRTMGKYLK